MQVSDTVRTYFPDLTDRQYRQFDQLQTLYQEWNEKVNVISRKDICNLTLHHVLHSLAIARVHAFQPGDRVMDLGTGGGFPGIPLAIMYPDTHFLLVDSIGKKIRVVNSIAGSLELTNTEGLHVRAEELDCRVDYVVSRAVTELGKFLEWCWDKIIPGDRHGVLYLKGGDLDSELRATEKLPDLKEVLVHPLSDFFAEPFFETKKVIHLVKAK